MAREVAKLIEINHSHEMYVSCALSRGSPSKLTRSPFDFLGIVLGNSILKKINHSDCFWITLYHLLPSIFKISVT